MQAKKSKFAFALLLAAAATFSAATASAQKFNSQIANPFAFCSAPKPCKICQPWRGIYEDICANQANASKTEDPDPTPPPAATPAKPTFTGTTRAQVLAEMTRLRAIWAQQGVLSTAAYSVVERCVQVSGRVQDGFCAAEMADFRAKAAPTQATGDELNRLDALLATLP